MAVVGVGALGRHHARILSQLESVELTAVSDANPETAARVAEQHGTHAVGDYSELFGNIDAACIAVPTQFHLSVAQEFLARRIPILVEKPLASNVEQARVLVELAERNETLLQVGHVERFNPATQVAWSACSAPKYIRAQRLSPYAFRSTDIGVVHDLMIHDLDLVLDLVRAPVARVEAFGISILGGHEDAVQARIAFANGCIADLTASRVNPTAERSMQIWSRRAMASVDFSSREVVTYKPSETLLFGASPLERARVPGADIEQLKRDIFEAYLKVARPEVPKSDALTDEIASFVDCVRRSATPLVGGREALAAMELADEILQCVAAHQWDGDVAGAVGPFFSRPHARKLAG
jgi:predicted dehydrogenase